jgi:hypothetical protein
LFSTHDIRNFLFSITLCVGLTGCGENDVLDSGKMSESDTYIEISMSYANMTRAVSDHPFGGEDGDGREYGRNYENDINNLCIFIYSDTDGKGINGNPATPIKAKYYFDNLSLTVPTEGFVTKPMKISGYVPSDNDRIIVFANRGNVLNDFTALGDFQSPSKWWAKNDLWTDNANPSLCKNFVMTSSRDDSTYGKMNVTGREGSYYDPFTAEVQIQRAMARVDIWYKDANKAADAGGAMIFHVDDNTGVLKLSHARIINVPNAYSTYPLKRVAATADNNGRDNAVLLGLETVVAGTHIPNNFVHTMLTAEKNVNNDQSWIDGRYDPATTLHASQAVDASGVPTYLKSDDYKVHAFSSDERVFSAGEDIDGDGKTDYCYTVGYCTENTMPIGSQVYKYMTGIAVKGTFVPAKVYTWSGGTLQEDPSYKEGDDIWHYFDKEDADATKSYYFSSEAAVRAYEQSRPAVAHSIDHYIKAQCYYYIWLRHAQPDASHPSGTFPMEYATVRNNIYRVGIEAVRTIGTPKPDPDPKEKVYSRVYVRKWNFRQQEEIVL